MKSMTSALPADRYANSFTGALTWLGIACLAATGRASQRQEPGPDVPPLPEVLLGERSLAAGTRSLEGSDLPAAVWEGIEREEYCFQPPSDEPATWSAPNRSQGFRSRISAQGAEVFPRETSAQESSSARWKVSLRTVNVGRGEDLVELGRGSSISAHGARVEIDHGALVEWFENRKEGLEQGWTIAAPPAGVGRLWIGLEFAGDLSLRIDDGSRSGALVDSSGEVQLRYRGLMAFDATNRELDARLTSSAAGVGIEIDDSAAIYPLMIDPLLTGPAWTAESEQDAAQFGWSVATAGDVNGDSYSDVIIGAISYDNGEFDEGRAFVFLGSAAGLTVNPAWTAESDQAGARFGGCVATAGDVNGDGYSDVIVGAYEYDNGQTGEGRAFVYLGSASGLAAGPAWTAESDQADAWFGHSVATGGDVNGDGYSDVIVGARLFDNPEINEGRAFLYLGSGLGLAASPAWTAESDQSSAFFGGSVATAGDVNGDGYGDVVVGAIAYTSGEPNDGRAYLYTGSAAGLATSPAWTAESDQVFSLFGVSVSTAGDVNGDGYSDVIVGAHAYDNGQTDEGRAYLYMGSGSGLAASPAWTAESDQDSATFGFSVATAGDVNGDGYSDVIVGAPHYDTGPIDAGGAFLYLGSAEGLAASAAWTAEGDQASALFGFSVATAGDVNADGYSDLIIGARGYDNGQTDEGRAFAYLGSASGLAASPGWTADGFQYGSELGASVATAGDVDGDGYSDVIVGAPLFDTTWGDEGRAYLYLGSSGGLTSSPAWTADGDQQYAELGKSVAAAGDVNGDGYGDVIVGAPGPDYEHAVRGAANVYLGSSVGLTTSPAWTVESDQDFAKFGGSVATAGDVNGDGFSDVIVGADAYTSGQAGEGRAYLYLGSAGGLGTSPAWTGESDQVGAEFGGSVATAGDVNGDGYSDVIVGAHAYDDGQTDEGRAFVYLGSANGLAATPAWTAESDQAGAHLGAPVTTAGDVNGDGYSDVIVGVSNYSNGQSSEGAAFVYLGSAAGLATSPAWTAESDQASSGFGSAVATAGDVNGDGCSDVIVGALLYDNGQAISGRAYLYLGSAGGLAASPAWTAESEQYLDFFGWSVATAGDVDGDGYSDAIVSAPIHDVEQGRVSLYLGNEGRGGWNLAPQQRRTNGTALIALLGISNSLNGFALRAHFERDLAGFTWATGAPPTARLEWEVEELGVGFDGMGLGSGTPQLVDGSLLAFDELVLGLVQGKPYHWRARLRTNNPLFPVTPWFTLPGNNRTETKLRTGSQSVSSFVPIGETTVAGTRSGSFTDTHTANVVYESIREIVSGGNPSQRYSYLEHKWTFQLTGAGSSLALNVKAYRTNSTDDDSFAFAYSTDNVNYTTALTVTRTSDNGTYQTASLPPTLNGTVWIRVVDTDRTPGHKTQDRIFVDHLYLRRQ